MPFKSLVSEKDHEKVANSTFDVLLTNHNGTTSGGAVQVGPRDLSPHAKIIITTIYVLGVLGNLLALYILHKERKTRYKNTKHTLMLR